MGKIKLNVLFFVIFFNFILFSENLVFFEDKVNDDYGKGDLFYPDNSFFKKGMFDLTYFKIDDEKDSYIFKIGFARKIEFLNIEEFKYNYSLPNEFFLQLIHIYIDIDHKKNSGIMRGIYGTKFEFDLESGWEYAIVVSSLAEKMKSEIIRKEKEICDRIIIPEKIKFSKDKKELFFIIPKEKITFDIKNCGFAILVLQHDFNGNWGNNVLIKEVRKSSGDWNFGGKISKEYESNIIDLIMPSGINQEEILSKFDEEKKIYVKIPMIYNEKIIEKTENIIVGKIIQISDNKIVINIGSKDGFKKGDDIIINDNIIAIIDDVFPEMSTAIIDKNKIKDLELDMKVIKLNK